MHTYKLANQLIAFGVIHAHSDGFLRVEVIQVTEDKDGGNQTSGASRLVDLHDQDAVDAIHEAALKAMAVPAGDKTMRGDLLAQLQSENVKLKATVAEQTARIAALEADLTKLESPPDVQADTAPAPT